MYKSRIDSAAGDKKSAQRITLVTSGIAEKQKLSISDLGNGIAMLPSNNILFPLPVVGGRHPCLA